MIYTVKNVYLKINKNLKNYLYHTFEIVHLYIVYFTRKTIF